MKKDDFTVMFAMFDTRALSDHHKEIRNEMEKICIKDTFSETILMIEGYLAGNGFVKFCDNIDVRCYEKRRLDVVTYIDLELSKDHQTQHTHKTIRISIQVITD